MKTNLKLNIIGAAIAFTLVFGGMAWGVTYVMGNIDTQTVQSAEVVKETPARVPHVDFLEYSSETRAINTLKEFHAAFDLEVTGGGIDRFTDPNGAAWDKFLRSEVFNEQKYRNIGKELYSIQGLEIDMATLIQLAWIAKEKHDPEALKFMHRILHDLDLYAFPGEETIAGDFWGVTNTVPAKDNARVSKMGAYIANVVNN
jgi:hypothetical protein